MSNLADVTPYDTDSTVASDYASATQRAALSGATALALGTVAASAALAVGAVVCARFLLSEDVNQQNAGRTRQQAERDAFARRTRRTPVAVALHASPEALLASARTLGFRPVDTPPTLDPRDRTPPPILLQNAAGERLALQPHNGRVLAATNRDLPSLHRVVHQHALLAAARHLAHVSGQPVRMRTLPSGAIELQATEPATGQPGGNATLAVQVSPLGTSRLDISGIRGKRCEQLLADYTRAVGGQARNVRFKPQHADTVEPGEPAHLRT